MRVAVWIQAAGPRPKAHGSAELIHTAQLAQFIDDAVRRRRIELRAVGVFQATGISSKFNNSGLHTQANAEVRDALGPGILNCPNHARNSTLPEAARHQDAIDLFKLSAPII